MSTQTRWPAQANTNEMVDVMLSWDFPGGTADLTRTPMVVEGRDSSASIQGTAVSAVKYGGVTGRYKIQLRDSWPWLLGHTLSVGTPAIDGAPPFTVKVTTDQANYQAASGPLVDIEVFDATGTLANPPAGHTLWGSLMFRNRKSGS